MKKHIHFLKPLNICIYIFRTRLRDAKIAFKETEAGVWNVKWARRGRYEDATIRTRWGGVKMTFFAALMVFFISMATVIGPTPPGTGVMKLAFFLTPVETFIMSKTSRHAHLQHSLTNRSLSYRIQIQLQVSTTTTTEMMLSELYL